MLRERNIRRIIESGMSHAQKNDKWKYNKKTTSDVEVFEMGKEMGGDFFDP